MRRLILIIPCLLVLALATPRSTLSMPRPPIPTPITPPTAGPVRWTVLEQRIVDMVTWNQARWYAAASTPPVAVTISPRPKPATRAQGFEGDVWWALSGCESTHTNAATGNGFFGFFQFTMSTWHSLGYSGSPTDYDYSTQRQAAQELQARSGWGQWPGCAARLGLR